MQVTDQEALAEIGRMALEMRLKDAYILRLEAEVLRLQEPVVAEPAEGQRD